MKPILYLVLFVLAFSCASKRESAERVDTKLAKQEVKTVEEINADTTKMVNRHSELSDKAKTKLIKYLNEATTKHSKLKDEESKVIQLLFSKSMRVNELSKKESRDKKTLKKRLKVIYKEKLKNVENLISKITSMIDSNEIGDTFHEDMFYWYRDFR